MEGGAGEDWLFGDSYGGVLVTPLSGYAASTDGDGSEVLGVTISGLPEGAALSAGTPVGGGVYVLAPAELLDLQLITVGQFPSFELTVEVSVQEYDPVTRVASSTSSLRSVTVTMPAVGTGNDVLDGGDGDDHLFGEAGDDLLLGGQGNDVIDTGSGHNRVDAGIGNDTVLAYGGDDIIEAGLGHDEVWAGDGANQIDLGDGDNYAEAGSGDDVILAGLGFDRVLAGGGANQISIGDGGGHIAAGSGNDSIQAGDGFERVLAGDGNNIIDLGDGGSEVAAGEGDDQVTTAAGDDVILAGGGVNRIASGSGKDTIVTLAGADVIDSGEGDDSVNSGAGDDQVSLGAGHDLLLAGEGNNDIDGGEGDDALYAGSGDDRALGGAGNDWIDLGAGRNIIDAGTGNDTIVAVQGEDSIDAGDGGDTLHVDGSDTIQGGLGLDTAYFSGDPILVDLAALGLEVVHATQGDDTLDASGTPVAMSLYGYAGKDTLLGSAFADELYGGDDDDSLDGGEGADILDGGAGDDSLRFDVSDTIDGGTGYDSATLIGDGDLIIDLHAVSVEKLISGAGQDVISSSGSTALNVNAGAGDDLITGSSANDILVGGAGQDRIDGGAGDDDITIDAEDFLATVSGGSGSDLLRVSGDFDLSVDLDATSFEKLLSSNGDDIVYHAERGLDLDGGAGIDTLNYATLASGIEVDLAAGTTSLGGKLSRFENLVGTAHADRLTGTSGDNIFTLNGGSDTVFGGEGFDIARLSGDLFDYNWAQQADGSWIVDNGSDSIHLTSIEQVEVGGHEIYLDGRNNAMIWTGQTDFDLIEDETSSFADQTVTDLVWDFDVNVLGTQSLDVVAVQGGSVSGDASGTSFSLLGDANFYGQTIASFQVSDGVDVSAWSNDFVVRVEGVNDAPVITGVVYTDDVYDANGVQGYVQVVEYDGDPVVFSWVSSAGTSGTSDGTTIGGLFQIDQGGNFILTPTAVADGYRVVGWDFTQWRSGPDGDQGARLSYYLYEESSLSYVEVQVIATDPEGLSSAAALLGQDFTSSTSTLLGSYSEVWQEGNGGTVVPSNKSTAVSWVEADIAANGAPPVVIDLDGDGLEIVPLADSQAKFDIDGDGALEAMTWVAPDDGFLAFDAKGDGIIDAADEIRFDGYHPDARTDMEGLRLAFDSNHDGQLTAADEQWDKFGVFQDLNGDGFCDPDEFKLLSDWGITAIGLTPSGELIFEEDHAILGSATVSFEDGSQTQAGDTILTYQELETAAVAGSSAGATPETTAEMSLEMPPETLGSAGKVAAFEAPFVAPGQIPGAIPGDGSSDAPSLAPIEAPLVSLPCMVAPETLRFIDPQAADMEGSSFNAPAPLQCGALPSRLDVPDSDVPTVAMNEEFVDQEAAELAGCLDLLAAEMARVSVQGSAETDPMPMPAWLAATASFEFEHLDNDNISILI